MFELTETAVTEFRQQMVDYLKLFNVQKDSNTVLLVTLLDSDGGFQQVKKSFALATHLSQTSSNFIPISVKQRTLETLLKQCGEYEEVVSTVRLLAIYENHKANNSNNTATVLTASNQQKTQKRSCSAIETTDNPSLMPKRKSLATSTPATETGSSANDNGRQVLLSCDLPIYQRDLDCLQPETYINDTIVDFYLKFLLEKHEEKNGRGKIYIFSSLFYSQLTAVQRGKPADMALTAAERRYQHVKNWVRKIDLFNKDYIFIPVNWGQHWVFLILIFSLSH